MNQTRGRTINSLNDVAAAQLRYFNIKNLTTAIGAAGRTSCMRTKWGSALDALTEFGCMPAVGCLACAKAHF